MNTSQQVRIFVINLKKSPDRRAYMEKLLDGINLTVANKVIALPSPNSLTTQGSDIGGDRNFHHKALISRLVRYLRIEKTGIFLFLRLCIYYIQAYLAKYNIRPYKKFDV